MAERYSILSKDMLFISDIRSISSGMNDIEIDERIIIDMNDQKRWHEIMNPRASMLKFRLPWNPGKTTYLKGKVR